MYDPNSVEAIVQALSGASGGSMPNQGMPPQPPMQQMAGQVLPLPIDPATHTDMANIKDSRLVAPLYATGNRTEPNVLSIGKPTLNDWFNRIQQRNPISR